MKETPELPREVIEKIKKAIPLHMANAKILRKGAEIGFETLLEHLQQQQPGDILLTPKEVDDKYQPENLEAKMSQFDYCSTVRIYSWGLIEGYEVARKDLESSYSLPPLSEATEAKMYSSGYVYNEFISERDNDIARDSFLEAKKDTPLRPLSEIGDEDKKELSRIIRSVDWIGDDIVVGHSFVRNIIHARLKAFEAYSAYEYLKSKGYALPQFFGIDHPDNGKTWPEANQSTNNLNK